MFSVSPISANTVSVQEIFSTYKKSQNQAQEIASVVYASLEYLTGSEDGISLQDLKNLSQTLVNENLTQNSAFKLVNTVITKFDSLSSDGQVITLDDFTGAVKFSVAQTFVSDSAIANILKQTGISVSEQISSLFGQANAQTLAFVDLMNSLSEQTIGKLIANINSSEKSESQTEKTNTKNMDINVQNYSTDVIKITDSATGLRLPINILV